MPKNEVIGARRCETCGRATTKKPKFSTKAVAALVAHLIRVAPHLDQLQFRPAVQALARMMLIARNASAWLTQNDHVSNDFGELRSSFESLARLNMMLIKSCRALGLTPDSFEPFLHEHQAITAETQAAIDAAHKVSHDDEDES